jgi:hypothetical protein
VAGRKTLCGGRSAHSRHRLIYTGYSEYLNTEVRRSWTYSDLMPRLPGLGIGLSPILQWLLVPAVALIWARRAGDDTAGRDR